MDDLSNPSTASVQAEAVEALQQLPDDEKLKVLEYIKSLLAFEQEKPDAS